MINGSELIALGPAAVLSLHGSPCTYNGATGALYAKPQDGSDKYIRIGFSSDSKSWCGDRSCCVDPFSHGYYLTTMRKDTGSIYSSDSNWVPDWMLIDASVQTVDAIAPFKDMFPGIEITSAFGTVQCKFDGGMLHINGASAHLTCKDGKTPKDFLAHSNNALGMLGLDAEIAQYDGRFLAFLGNAAFPISCFPVFKNDKVYCIDAVGHLFMARVSSVNAVRKAGGSCFDLSYVLEGVERITGDGDIAFVAASTPLQCTGVSLPRKLRIPAKLTPFVAADAVYMAMYNRVKETSTIGLIARGLADEDEIPAIVAFEIASQNLGFKDGMITYLGSKGSEVSARPVKAIKKASRILSLMPDHVARTVVDKIVSQCSGTATRLEGDDLVDAYDAALGCSSCMTGLSAFDNQHYLEIYAKNPDRIGLMKFKSGPKYARALIWKADDGNQYLDRVYPSDTPCWPFIMNWLRENNVKMCYSQRDCPDALIHRGKLVVTIVDKHIPDFWPYMDTFNNLVTDRYVGSGKKGTVWLFTDCGEAHKFCVDMDCGDVWRYDLCSTDGNACEIL